MATLALDASQDIPTFEQADLPTLNGLTLFGCPLPPVMLNRCVLPDGQPWAGEVPLWGMRWHLKSADDDRPATHQT